MAERTRQTWGAMRAQIRRKLDSTDEANSHWTNELLLDLFNDAKERREARLMETYEGYTTEIVEWDLIENEPYYGLPEATFSVSRATITSTAGHTSGRTVPLQREENYYNITYSGAGNYTYNEYYYVPTYRLINNYLELTPVPTSSGLGVLRIEAKTSSPIFTADSDILPDSWPPLTERLLVYDVVLLATKLEGALPDEAIALLDRERRAIEVDWLAAINPRSDGIVRAIPFDLGG